jgi:hypothetical protein
MIVVLPLTQDCFKDSIKVSEVILFNYDYLCVCVCVCVCVVVGVEPRALFLLCKSSTT